MEAVLAKEIQLKHMAPVIDIEVSTQIWTQLPTDLAAQVLDARGAKVPADSEAVGSLPHKVSMSSEHNSSQRSPFSSGSDHERRTIQDFFLASTKPHRKIQGGSIFDKFNPLYPIDHFVSGDGQ